MYGVHQRVDPPARFSWRRVRLDGSRWRVSCHGSRMCLVRFGGGHFVPGWSYLGEYSLKRDTHALLPKTRFYVRTISNRFMLKQHQYAPKMANSNHYLAIGNHSAITWQSLGDHLAITGDHWRPLGNHTTTTRRPARELSYNKICFL